MIDIQVLLIWKLRSNLVKLQQFSNFKLFAFLRIFWESCQSSSHTILSQLNSFLEKAFKRMSTENFFRNQKPIRIFLLVMIFGLWRLSDGGRVERRPHYKYGHSAPRGIFCDNYWYSCLDATGKFLKYVCIPLYPRWSLECTPDHHPMRECRLTRLDAVNAVPTKMVC